VGYFNFENCTEAIIPVIKIPSYHSVKKGISGNSVEGQGFKNWGIRQVILKEEKISCVIISPHGKIIIINC